jgi:hypothetical protein
MKLRLLAAAAALAAGAAAAPSALAAPLPIVGGVTSVTLTAAPLLDGAGLMVDAVGSAVLSPGSDGTPIAYFGVTGGSLDTGTFAGRIEHAGSGLRLESLSASVFLTGFVIDTSAGLLTGTVTVDGLPTPDVALFDVGLSGNPFSPFSLTLSAAAGAALAGVFGIPDLTGTVIGTANTIPITVVPEPATVASMLAGLLLIGAVMNRRRERQED